MPQYELNSAQWCVLDLLIHARNRGVYLLNRLELLSSNALPLEARLKLAFAALTVPDDLVVWEGKHDFKITDAGISLYKLKFGEQAKPSEIAGEVFALPDRSAERLQ